MRVKAIYKPGQHGDIMISPDELERSYRTLIGKPVRLNFDKEIGVVVDAQHYKNDEIELTLELPELRGEYIAHDIQENSAKAITFTGVSIIVSTKQRNGGE